MFDSRETLWISGSIALLVIILLGMRFNVLDRTPTVEEALSPDAVVVVPKEGQTTEDALVEALAANASLQGSLRKLVVLDLIIGEGAIASKGDTLTVNYAGNTEDGVTVDSSYMRGAPYTFTLGNGTVIEGWEKGLVGMKTGGKRALIIPAHMAYGSRQVGPIPPNTALVYVVELLEVQSSK